MGTVERFEDLDVWKRSRELVNIIYDISEIGRFSKDYALRDQMRRSAVSIMSNISEGFESRTQKLFIEYLGRAKGSAGEFRSQLYLSAGRDYISEDAFAQMLSSIQIISKQIANLIRYLQSQPYTDRIQEEVANDYV